MKRAGRIPLTGVALLVCLAGVPGSAGAQSGTATLFGQVKDAQDADVPGATVTLTHVGTSATRTMVTGESGSYRFPALQPGEYSLKVEMDGFRTAVQHRIVLSVDTSTQVDVPLLVGSIAETVQVTADTPALNTSDASLGNVISGTQIRELPLEARNVVGLLGMQPGVVYIPRANAETTMDPRFGSVSGARADQANVTLDGIDVNDAQNQNAFTSVLRVSLDAVQEFRVTTSNYGADQGRSSGAQVSLITRSGTNALSGAGFYVNRDTSFSSNEYFLKLSQLQAGNPSEPPRLDKHIYGGAAGDPSGEISCSSSGTSRVWTRSAKTRWNEDCPRTRSATAC
jgi:Carboxypeptidase regulatory-like domain